MSIHISVEVAVSATLDPDERFIVNAGRDKTAIIESLILHYHPGRKGSAQSDNARFNGHGKYLKADGSRGAINYSAYQVHVPPPVADRLIRMAVEALDQAAKR